MEALRRWASATYGGPVELAEPVDAKGEGFDSAIFLVRLRGDVLPPAWRGPLVLRVKSDEGRFDEARREAALHAWLLERDYPVPAILAVLEPGVVAAAPAQVMARAPGALLLDAVKRRPWLARSGTARLAALHTRLHALDPAGAPLDADVLDRRLRLVRTTAEALDHAGLRAALDRVDRMAPRLRRAEPSVCHGDFHPLNVLVDGATATVIDWTDAGVGDRHADVARTLALFEVAAIAATHPLERRLLAVAGPWLGRRYREAYARVAPLDGARIAAWTPVHVLHGWSQAIALHAGLFDRAGHDDHRARVPVSMVDELQRRFDAALGAV